MELITCLQCGEKVSKTVRFCPNCGNKLSEKVEPSKETKNHAKKPWIAVGSIVIICIIAAIVCNLVSYFSNPLEKNAKKCLHILENIVGNVDLTDAVSLSIVYQGDDTVSYRYLLVYEQDGDTDIAFFNDEYMYMGNGYNGAFASDSGNQSFYNVLALSALEDYLEYLLNNDLAITYEEAETTNREGLIQLDVKKIE